MTETVSGASKAGSKSKGLSITRRFSTEGVHPYDEITWERRDVVQTNWKTGETVFEQRGVEFPDFWSVNASTIVTTKYFRGALNTDIRETSLRELDEVAYLRFAAVYKQFETAEDFEIEIASLRKHRAEQLSAILDSGSEDLTSAPSG